MMEWTKVKQLFHPEKLADWMHSHAANPVPVVLDEEKKWVRIFFTSRNEQNISHIGFVDIDFSTDDFTILNLPTTPLLTPGNSGLFDDSGCAMGCIIHHADEYYLFYLGWNLKVTVPWLNTIGLAKSSSLNGPFAKYSLAPVLDRSAEDPYTISYPSIIHENGVFKMWYGSNLSWGKTQDQMNHVIKYAESVDLIHWNRTNEVHIPLMHPNEYALSKPWVLRMNDGYHMWYSYRANGRVETYRIGYAHSLDGKSWTRLDHLSGIDVSPHSWDSDMICYPSVFQLGDETYMLYNGNGYGKTGFGLAKLNKQ